MGRMLAIEGRTNSLCSNKARRGIKASAPMAGRQASVNWKRVEVKQTKWWESTSDKWPSSSGIGVQKP
jgi:hypothetical protein